MKKFANNFKTRAAAAFATVGAVTSTQVMAIDDTAVDTAYSNATTSIDGATVGLIGLVAVTVGVGLLISLFKKA